MAAGGLLQLFIGKVSLACQVLLDMSNVRDSAYMEDGITLASFYKASAYRNPEFPDTQMGRKVKLQDPGYIERKVIQHCTD